MMTLVSMRWRGSWRGWAMLCCSPNTAGSTGYGAQFLAAIYQHFGDRAYQDVDSATDYALEQGWADPNRLAIFGWSAGGFMTSWTVTQTGRYKAAIDGSRHHRLGALPVDERTWRSSTTTRAGHSKIRRLFRKFSAVDYANKVRPLRS